MNILAQVRKLSVNERWLVYGQAVSTVGDYMALPAFLKIAIERGAGVTSFFLVLYFLPRVVQPFLGVLVDRFNARSLILISEAARTLLFLALFVCSKDTPTYIWLVFPLLISLFSCIFEPARLRIMSAISSDFKSLNAVFYFFYSSTGIVSIGLSILVEMFFETRVVFLVNAITFIASFLMLIPIRFQENKALRIKSIRIQDFSEGLRFFFQKKHLHLTTGLVILIDFFTGILYELFGTKSLMIGFPDNGTYIYALLICVGNSVGSFLIPLIYDRRATWPLLALLSFSAVWYFLISQNPIISFASSLVFFTTQIIAIGISEIEIENNTPVPLQGRLFALNESFPVLALSLGSMVAGFVSSEALTHLCYIAVVLYCFLKLGNISKNRHSSKNGF